MCFVLTHLIWFHLLHQKTVANPADSDVSHLHVRPIKSLAPLLHVDWLMAQSFGSAKPVQIEQHASKLP